MTFAVVNSVNSVRFAETRRPDFDGDYEETDSEEDRIFTEDMKDKPRKSLVKRLLRTFRRKERSS